MQVSLYLVSLCCWCIPFILQTSGHAPGNLFTYPLTNLSPVQSLFAKLKGYQSTWIQGLRQQIPAKTLCHQSCQPHHQFHNTVQQPWHYLHNHIHHTSSHQSKHMPITHYAPCSWCLGIGNHINILG